MDYLRLTKLTKAVVLSAAALALAVPASTWAQPSHRARQQFAHQWTHRGSGVTAGPEFNVQDADVLWTLGWFCPAGGGYGLHVNLEVYKGGFGPALFFPSWTYTAKVYGHDGADGQTHIVSGVERIHYYTTSLPWRFTFHAAGECHYEILAEWD